MVSMTTDYAADTGCALPYLERIAKAGFSEVHWCHHWGDDFVYAESEVREIGRWMGDLGLGLNSLHGSSGREKGWASTVEYERLAGVDLVKNRIVMTAELAGDVVVMHAPGEGLSPTSNAQLVKSLDALEDFARGHGVRIAVENGDWSVMEEVLARYDEAYVGLCYDSGHANQAPGGVEALEKLKGRLIAVHLHDNDGKDDQHRLPFTGTADWEGVARVVAGSSYAKCVNLESIMDRDGDEDSFLREAGEAAERLSQMIERWRKGEAPSRGPGGGPGG